MGRWVIQSYPYWMTTYDVELVIGEKVRTYGGVGYRLYLVRAADIRARSRRIKTKIRPGARSDTPQERAVP
jgi:hypothetical protein